jgi:DtxR family Mn-dependent transcriptional regulator
MITPTVENYLKQLYAEHNPTAMPLLPMGRLARAMNVTPGTATTMVKSLADAGLVRYEPRDGVCLTAEGERRALNVIRRHRLVEVFLVQTLGLDWSEVHDEAEQLEHAISDKVLDALDAFLGHPEFDPHGDPIPRAKGKFSPVVGKNLLECSLNTPVRILRVTDQDAGFLQTARRIGLVPGASLEVTGRDPHTDSVALLIDVRQINLGGVAAAKILVEPVPTK